MTFRDHLKMQKKSVYRKSRKMTKNEAMMDTMDDQKKLKRTSKLMRVYDWFKQQLLQSKEALSRRLGTKPLPFYYKFGDDYQTQHMTWKHTFSAIFIILIIVYLFIWQYTRLSSISTISTWMGFAEELQSGRSMNGEKLDFRLDLTIGK